MKKDKNIIEVCNPTKNNVVITAILVVAIVFVLGSCTQSLAFNNVCSILPKNPAILNSKAFKIIPLLVLFLGIIYLYIASCLMVHLVKRK